MRAHVLVVLASLGLAVVPIVRAQVQGTTPPPYAPPPGATYPPPPATTYPPPTATTYPPPAPTATTYPTYAPYPTYASPYATAYPPPTYSPYGPPPGAPQPPKQLDYDEGQPIPAGYHRAERARPGPVIAGSITFGVLWLASVLTSVIGTPLGDDNLRDLWIPVVGPFITISREDSNRSTPTLAIDGVGQAIGLGLLVWGITSPRTVLLRNDISGVELHAMPIVSHKTAGFGFGGVF
jgi:hypothetical protein